MYERSFWTMEIADTRMKLYETASTCFRADALQDMAFSHIDPPTELRIMKFFF